MADYQLTASEVVVRTIDDVNIPGDPENRDRITYNAWLADGGVPDPYLVPLPSVTFDWGRRFVEIIGQEK